MLRSIYTSSLTSSPAYEQLRELTTRFPGRLSGSKNLEGAVQWARDILEQTGCDQVKLQPVLVPHWERGLAESVHYFSCQFTGPASLAALALGGSVPILPGGLRAHVIELKSLKTLPTEVKGRIVFFNRPMNPEYIATGQAYAEAGDQRNRDTGGSREIWRTGRFGTLVDAGYR